MTIKLMIVEEGLNGYGMFPSLFQCKAVAWHRSEITYTDSVYFPTS